MTAPSATRTIPQLIADAKLDVGGIVSDTVALAKAETGASARRIGIGAGLLVVALGVAWFILVALTIAFGFGLVAAGLPIWASFLIVAGAYLLITAALVFVAIWQFKKIEAPTRTMAAIKGTFAALGGSGSSEFDLDDLDEMASRTA